MEARSRTTVYAVTRPNDPGPSPYIPTNGYPASASDLFRVAAVHTTGHEEWNSCFTDVNTCIALARVVEGEVSSMADLDAAEMALQCLMWHERIDVMVPGFKLRNDRFVGYAPAQEKRSPLCFDLFQPCQPYDQIYAVEEVTAHDGIIKSSNLFDSGIIEAAVADATRGYLEKTPLQAMALSSIPIDFGVPAYFTDPLVEPFTGYRGFFGQFYQTVDKGWREAIAAVPEINVVIPLPPVLAVVLDRAKSRDTIPAAIHELRDELSPVRREMLRFSEMVRGARRQKEIENDSRDIKQSFEAVVRASRQQRGVILLPLLKLYRSLRSPLDLIINALNPDYTPKDRHWLANRTVTGKMFSRLLATDSMHSLVSNFFNDAEIRNLERSRQTSRAS
jgi:hypothetical protein